MKKLLAQALSVISQTKLGIASRDQDYFFPSYRHDKQPAVYYYEARRTHESNDATYNRSFMILLRSDGVLHNHSSFESGSNAIARSL